MNLNQQIEFGLLGMKSAKKMDIKTPEEAKRKHLEAELHLSFCAWLKKEYPNVMFVRHEKERSRSAFLGNVMQKYNSLDGLPDFECLEQSGALNVDVECENCDHVSDYFVDGRKYQGLYIEFKKPGEDWLEVRTGLVKKAYAHQYKCHLHLWSIGRCAYFCNDLEQAKKIFLQYISAYPLPKQEYGIHYDINNDFSL